MLFKCTYHSQDQSAARLLQIQLLTTTIQLPDYRISEMISWTIAIGINKQPEIEIIKEYFIYNKSVEKASKL